MFTTFLWRRAGAEFVGTYALLTAGCGAIVVNTLTGALSHVGVAFSFGLAITVMIAAAGHLSGAHFNPAVTLAFALTRHFPWREVPLYPVSEPKENEEALVDSEGLSTVAPRDSSFDTVIDPLVVLLGSNITGSRENLQPMSVRCFLSNTAPPQSLNLLSLALL